MAGQNGHITIKVIIGYMLLVAIAGASIWYVYDVIKQITAEDNVDHNTTKKVYLITHTLSLIYESETLGVLIEDSTNTYRNSNRKLNEAHRNMDSLKSLVNSPEIKAKIDTICNLIDNKRWNMQKLLSVWKDINSDRLYTKNIERLISIQDTTINLVHVKKNITVVQDSVVVPPKKKKGFFRRLAEAFVPPKEVDSSFVINSTQKIVADTLLNTYNPSDTIVRVLKSIQDSVFWQRQNLSKKLIKELTGLQYYNSLMTKRINQLLSSIEDEEVQYSLEKAHENQIILKDTLHKLSMTAITSVVVVIFFLIIIIRSVWKSQYYRKQLEQAKQHVEGLLETRERMMLTISHDIRAPLSSIIGYIELLERLHIDERQAYYLNNMQSSAQHILSLVNDLLDFHRLESGKMEIHPIPFEISALFSEIYWSFKPLADAKGLNLIYDSKLDDSKQLYMGDTIRIRQIVSNLLSNAIKFTSEGDVKLRIYLEKENDSGIAQLDILVKDQGPGIPKEEQERIFCEFTRLEESEHIEGFGLGLSITRKLLALMDGTMSLNSDIGTGCEFIVTIPLTKANGKLEGIRDSNSNQSFGTAGKTFSGKTHINCLLVDDDLTQLAVTKEFLNLEKVSVETCSVPQKVLSTLIAGHFDIVITDIQMPGFDGYRLLKEIRNSKIKAVAEIPIVALSADISNNKDHFIESGFDGFLNKPFTSEQLILLLNKLLNLDLKYEKSLELNFNNFLSFAGDDREASLNILKSFVEENRKNLTLLMQLANKDDKESVSRIAHKMIPLFSMLGAEKLVPDLRILELEASEMELGKWKKLVDDIINRIKTILNEVENKITES